MTNRQPQLQQQQQPSAPAIYYFGAPAGGYGGMPMPGMPSEREVYERAYEEAEEEITGTGALVAAAIIVPAIVVGALWYFGYINFDEILAQLGINLQAQDNAAKQIAVRMQGYAL